MNEDEVRSLVRQAIARHLAPTLPLVPHVAAARFDVRRPPGERECVIEPAVACNHCGFCQCYGH